MLHNFMIDSQGRRLICRANNVFWGSVEVFAFDQASFIENPAMGIICLM